MSQNLEIDGRVDQRDDPGAVARPRLRVRTIERTAIVRFVDAEILSEEATVRAVGQQLQGLIEAGGYARLLLNLTGVRYMSSDVLGILAKLQKKVDSAGGRIGLYGLAPLLRDMLRITHLDRAFDVCADEAEALGLPLPWRVESPRPAPARADGCGRDGPDRVSSSLAVGRRYHPRRGFRPWRPGAIELDSLAWGGRLP